MTWTSLLMPLTRSKTCEYPTTQVRLLSGGSTRQIPVDSGTIQGDTLSPFLFLLCMKPLLRWLHVGGRGYQHSCIPNQNATDTHLANILSSAVFADDLLCPTYTIQDLKSKPISLLCLQTGQHSSSQAAKLRSLVSLKVTPPKDNNGVTSSRALRHHFQGEIEIQGQEAEFLPSDLSFLNFGVQLTMDSNWKHRTQRMTRNLREQLENLDFSLTSPRQAKNMICRAISPSLAYAFAVTPCTPADLIIWDKMIDRTIKCKYKLSISTAAAMI
eukprot:1150872-Pelagomonas_calceolata.AAC.4